LDGRCDLGSAIVRIEQFPSLCFLPAGKPKVNPSELLDSDRWSETCASLRGWFGYVVFDTPPVAAVADYDLIQTACDGVVLVMRSDHSNRKLCLQTLEVVPREKLVGVVMNCVKDWFLAKSESYYYYPRAV
jgi:Mrp family chromosome partitioning ATPase